MSILSPRQKARLHRQAVRAAQLSDRPAAAQARQQIKGVRRSTRREAQSIRGAYNVAADAVAATHLHGLHGRYRRQIGKEVALRTADLRHAVPFQVSAVRSQAQDQIAQIRAGLPNVGADAAANYASAAADLKKSIQTRTQSAKKTQDTAKQAVKDDVAKAAVLAKNLLQTSVPPWSPAAIATAGSYKKSFALFQKELMAQKGVTDPRVAAAVIKRLEAQHKGLTGWAKLGVLPYAISAAADRVTAP